MNKETALKLLAAAFEDELAHLELRMIRDAQAPRFEALKDTHPEIYEDFMKARTGPHEVLLKNRRKRVEILTKYIEGDIENDRVLTMGRNISKFMDLVRQEPPF